MIQWNTIGVILIYGWKHLIRNTVESSLMLFYPRCIQSSLHSASILWLQLSTLTCQYFHNIGSLTCRNPCMMSLDLPSLCHLFIKVWLLIKFLISFKVDFNQAFFTSAGNLVTSEKFLGYGIKCDTSEPDSTKLYNAFFNSFTTALNNLCKPLLILFAESSDPFHSFCVCLIRSRILNLASHMLIYGCIWLLFWISLRAFVLIYPSLDSSSVYN